MSVSQNTENEQQNNLCTTLTEQWKKGELEQGYYYTKYNPKVGKPFVEIELRNYLLDLAKVRDAETVEVLAPVPSYEEWQRIFHYASKYEYEYTSCAMDYENLKQENQQLKELLKECREWIEFLSVKTKAEKSPKNAMYFEVLLLKIDNAIGADNDKK